MAKSGAKPGAGPTRMLEQGAIEAFEERLRGEVLTVDDAGYDDARLLWNGMIDKYPVVIARCSGTADVIEAVAFAREHDLPLAVRGGGHNVAGTAVCDGGIVVDLAEIDDVRVDPETQTVRVGGGATLGDVDRETQVFDLAVPLGVVSETGVAGLTLNGGYGHLRRKYGLACDSLRSVDVVTADGEVVTASAERNPDLFWAIRGGGGNFGVATSFEFDCYEVGPEVFTLFAWYPAETIASGLQQFREWASDAPDEASVVPFVAFVPETEEFPESAWGDPALVVLGCWAGEVGEGETAFEPLRRLGDPILDASGPMAYAELQELLDEDYPDGRRYYWKSVYLAEIDDEVIDLLARLGRASPSNLSTVDLWHLGGAIEAVAPDATAFWHREPAYLLNFEANWDDPEEDDENVAWVREGVAEVRDLSVASGEYANFPGFNEDPARTIFGDNYERLVEIKSRYDPENLFRLNTNVQPASESVGG